MTHAEAGRGIGLPRLIGLARLTPTQAITLAVDVLTAGSGSPPAPAAVELGPDGRARLRGAAAARADSPAALLTALAAAARQGPPPTGRAAEALTALDTAAAQAAAGCDARALAEPLRTLVAAAGPAPRLELVRLVAAATGRAQPHGGPARASIPTIPTPAAPGTGPPGGAAPWEVPGGWRAGLSRTVRRTWPWVASIAVLAVVLMVELLILRDDVARDVVALLDAGRDAPTSAPTGPPPLPPVAPAAAGGVLGVDLRAVRLCTPDAACEVRVQVRVGAQPVEQTVAWDYRVLDRCTGAGQTVAGGSAVVGPGGDRVDVVGTVAVPPGEALAVVAVTREPAVTASPPLPVPAAGTCPANPGGRAG